MSQECFSGAGIRTRISTGRHLKSIGNLAWSNLSLTGELSRQRSSAEATPCSKKTWAQMTGLLSVLFLLGKLRHWEDEVTFPNPDRKCVQVEFVPLSPWLKHYLVLPLCMAGPGCDWGFLPTLHTEVTSPVAAPPDPTDRIPFCLLAKALHGTKHLGLPRDRVDVPRAKCTGSEHGPRQNPTPKQGHRCRLAARQSYSNLATRQGTMPAGGRMPIDNCSGAFCIQHRSKKKIETLCGPEITFSLIPCQTS